MARKGCPEIRAAARESPVRQTLGRKTVTVYEIPVGRTTLGLGADLPPARKTRRNPVGTPGQMSPVLRGHGLDQSPGPASWPRPARPTTWVSMLKGGLRRPVAVHIQGHVRVQDPHQGHPSQSSAPWPPFGYPKASAIVLRWNRSRIFSWVFDRIDRIRVHPRPPGCRESGPPAPPATFWVPAPTCFRGPPHWGQRGGTGWE